MIKIDKMIMDARREGNINKLEAYQLVKARIMEFKTRPNVPDYTDEVEVGILQKMAKELKEDIKMYADNSREEMLDQATKQLAYIEEMLPEIPTEQDAIDYVEKNYPNGIEKSMMGKVVKEVKSSLLGIDGKTVATVIKNHLI